MLSPKSWEAGLCPHFTAEAVRLGWGSSLSSLMQLPQRSMAPFWSQPSPTVRRQDFDFRAPLVLPSRFPVIVGPLPWHCWHGDRVCMCVGGSRPSCALGMWQHLWLLPLGASSTCPPALPSCGRCLPTFPVGTALHPTENRRETAAVSHPKPGCVVCGD